MEICVKQFINLIKIQMKKHLLNIICAIKGGMIALKRIKIITWRKGLLLWV